MGYKLYREVLEHAPPDITSGELLVWLVIADDAKDATRCGWIDQDELMRRARMSARGIRAALGKLAGRGFELRVARGVDRDGRPVFAHRGSQTTYRLPRLAVDEPVDNSEKDGTTVPPSVEKGGTTVPERRYHSAAKAAPQFPPSPQFPQSPQQAAPREDSPVDNPAAEVVRWHTDATDLEAAAVAALIDLERQPRNLTAFVRRLADDGELADWLDRVRVDANRETVRAFLAGLPGLPECVHGMHGGGALRPDTGEPQCASCRAVWRARSA